MRRIFNQIQASKYIFKKIIYAWVTYPWLDLMWAFRSSSFWNDGIERGSHESSQRAGCSVNTILGGHPLSIWCGEQWRGRVFPPRIVTCDVAVLPLAGLSQSRGKFRHDCELIGLLLIRMSVCVPHLFIYQVFVSEADEFITRGMQLENGLDK